MNVLEQLVNEMNGANSKHRLQKKPETTMDETMAMRFAKEPHRFPVFTGTTNQPAPRLPVFTGTTNQPAPRFPVFTGTTNQPASRGGGLSRAKRDAGQQKNDPVKGVMKSLLDRYCDTKSGTCNQTTEKLDFVQFHAVFNESALIQHRSTMKANDTRDPNRVTIGGQWPVVIGTGCVIKYIKQGSPLDIYETHKHKTADNSTLLEGNSDFASTFTVKTSGLYAVHLNITILDEDEKPGKEHYIGLHLNDQAVLACLNGGFRCPDNLDDSSKVRICNMNGILNLKYSDRIQVKTMEANTTIRIETKRNSLLTLVLLHKN